VSRRTANAFDKVSTIIMSESTMQEKRQLYRLAITLVFLWVLLSGIFTPLHFLLGLISIAIALYISVRMDVLMHKKQPLYFRFFRVLQYFVWLIGQILLSNLDVVRRIFSPTLDIKPILKAIPSSQATELGRVIYANSITLTPGTVAINIAKNGDVLVHALHADVLSDLEKGTMGERVSLLEPRLGEALFDSGVDADTDTEKDEVRSEDKE
jgi:multicomponent Na+:H+ antiporter subunit E